MANKRIGLSIVAVLVAVALLAGVAGGLSASRTRQAGLARLAQAETWDYPLSNTDFETGDLSGWASTGAVQVVGGGMPEGVYAAELGWDAASAAASAAAWDAARKWQARQLAELLDLEVAA